MNRLDAIVHRIKREILDDIADGVLPADVGSFTDLHDHTDANVYGGLCDENADVSTEDLAEHIQPRVDAWLRDREAG